MKLNIEGCIRLSVAVLQQALKDYEEMPSQVEFFFDSGRADVYLNILDIDKERLLKAVREVE